MIMTYEEFMKLLDKELCVRYGFVQDRMYVTNCHDTGGDILLHGPEYQEIPDHITFSNRGCVWIKHLKKLPGNVTIINGGAFRLDYATEVPAGTSFLNGGDVVLPSLKKLSKNTTFVNRGNVVLEHVTEMPGDTLFQNDGDIILTSLPFVPKGMYFSNTGKVYFDKLRKFNNLPPHSAIKKRYDYDSR